MAEGSVGEIDVLKLENQLCFPLYACSREIVKRYRPLLDPLGLTYTQYIAMMVMWEYGSITSRKMGALLHLDSGTLTPLLKALEEKGFITRSRGADKRNLDVAITPAGEALRTEAEKVPPLLASCIELDSEDAAELYRILGKLLVTF